MKVEDKHEDEDEDEDDDDASDDDDNDNEIAVRDVARARASCKSNAASKAQGLNALKKYDASMLLGRASVYCSSNNDLKTRRYRGLPGNVSDSSMAHLTA